MLTRKKPIGELSLKELYNNNKFFYSTRTLSLFKIILFTIFLFNKKFIKFYKKERTGRGFSSCYLKLGLYHTIIFKLFNIQNFNDTSNVKNYYYIERENSEHLKFYPNKKLTVKDFRNNKR